MLARLAERGRIECDDELSSPGRRTLVVEKRRGVGGEIRPREAGGEQFHHQHQRGALGVAERQHGAGERGVGIGGGFARGIERPALGNALALLPRRHDIAARHLREREIDHHGRPARQGTREGDRVGAEHRFRRAPRRDGGRRVGEHHGDELALGEALDRMAGGAAMVRAANRGARDAARPCHLGKQRERGLDRGKREAVDGIDHGRPRPRARDGWRRKSIDLADLRLRRIGRQARKAVALEPVGFGRHQRAGDDCRVHPAGAAAHERAGDETFGLGQRQRCHSSVIPKSGDWFSEKIMLKA